ncbi:hypothetical protein H6P81_014518 [Aristolochia fimbriata]|uniref:Protein kinase domain-containing protein n=1 Tax=Aristolochia fimbriata TaxID=158543 RepID=A0AAV7EJV1_ARIFI|nr:hypothetical protein H6P81_014518 [Aristolochia fimbriata]
MEQFRQIGEVLGSLKALMVFRQEIRINQRQCSLLVDMYNHAFEVIAEEIKHNLKFQEKSTKWKVLEHPLKELHRIFREGELYIRQCLETKDWWARAISLAQNTDCVEFHLHNLLTCLPVVHEVIEVAGEIAGCDEEEMRKKRIMFSKMYEKEWMDPKIFQRKFGKQYLVSHDLCHRMDSAWREDRWLLLEMIGEKRSLGSSALTKQEHRISELLFANLDRLEPSKGKLFPSSFLVGSSDYKLKRRLGNGSQYKEIEWMGENFAVRHIFGHIEPLIPEISLLSSISHPHVMHFLCGFSDEEKKECFLVMEMMNKDLNSLIKEICGPRRRIPFSLPVAVDIMLQIARGMEYLHSRKLCHGNLNTSNILVNARNSSSDGYFHVKVSGFGLASVKNCPSRTSPNQTAANPFIWYAPEVLLELEQSGNPCISKYTEKADVYSFGMVCFELLMGKVPFEDSHLQGDKVSRNVRAGERPLFPYPTPKYLSSITKRCWQADPANRPNFSSVCRILRYIKRFLLMNPDHSQPDPPLPPVDYFDLDANLSRKFASRAVWEVAPVSQIPFQMFAYRVIEKDKTTSTTSSKEKSSESGSDGASACGDENVSIPDDPFPAPLVRSRSPSLSGSSSNGSIKRISTKKTLERRNSKSSGLPWNSTGQQTAPIQKGRALRPPQTTPCGRSLRMNSEGQLLVANPSRRKKSGHMSDSELT